MESVQIGRYRVDVHALATLEHECVGDACPVHGDCCRTYEVTLSRGEMERAAGLTKACGRYAPAVAPGGEFDNPFDEGDRGRYVMDTHEDGACVFAYAGAKGGLLCSLHSAALDTNLDPVKAKPSSCTLWPLAISEGKRPAISVQDGVMGFPCNTKRRAKATLHEGVREILDALFGVTFRAKVEEALPGSKRVR